MNGAGSRTVRVVASAAPSRGTVIGVKNTIHPPLRCAHADWSGVNVEAHQNTRQRKITAVAKVAIVSLHLML